MNTEVEDYLDKEDESISQSGVNLLEYVEACGEKVRLPLTTQLFPYLFMASRKMTTRELSAWLEQNEGIKLSSAAIAKGLKRPELHLQRLADFVQNPANYLCAVYGWSVEAVLFDQDPVKGISYLELLAEEISYDPDGPGASIASALQTLRTIWKPIPEEVKYMCRRYFVFANDSDKEADTDEEDYNSPTTAQCSSMEAKRCSRCFPNLPPSNGI